MTKLLALAQFLLALAGCSPGAQTWSHRIAGNAGDALRSDVVVEDGTARFQCLESGSGACHYTLYPAHPLAGDAPAPLRRFTVARGEERRIAGLAGFVPCVAAGEAQPPADCAR